MIDYGGEGGARKHPHWCDCAGCWTGITDREAKPPSLFERIRRKLLAADAREHSAKPHPENPHG